MSSTVKSRPNHYEVLGLTPAASSDEIAQAFAKELSDRRPRAFGSLATVTIAYETLRDRIKREAYDISLGLRPKPKPKPPAPSPAAPAEWSPLRASPRQAPQPAKDLLSRFAPKADAAARSEPVAEPKLPPSAAASRREPIHPKPDDGFPKPSPIQQEPVGPEAMARPRAELPSGEGRLHFAEAGRFKMDGESPLQWKIPALAGGVLILAVCVGAWTGLEAGNDNEQGQAENAVTMKVPPAKPLPEVPGSPLALPPRGEAARPQQPTRATAAAAPVERARPPLQIALPEAQSGETARSSQSPSGEIATDQAAAESPSVEATPARMPLPNAVIARTIGRIGYPCGEVASTTAIDGAAGAFKVTCTSGHSYRAAPVGGRYRFRRLG